ncbi:hypothetical protein MRX96_045365 [Rhipicephalus microplus]
MKSARRERGLHRDGEGAERAARSAATHSSKEAAAFKENRDDATRSQLCGARGTSQIGVAAAKASSLPQAPRVPWTSWTPAGAF